MAMYDLVGGNESARLVHGAGYASVTAEDMAREIDRGRGGEQAVDLTDGEGIRS